MRMGVRIIIKPAKFFMAFLLSLNFVPILSQKISFVKCFFHFFLFSTIFINLHRSLLPIRSFFGIFITFALLFSGIFITFAQLFSF